MHIIVPDLSFFFNSLTFLQIFMFILPFLHLHSIMVKSPIKIEGQPLVIFGILLQYLVIKQNTWCMEEGRMSHIKSTAHQKYAKITVRSR